MPPPWQGWDSFEDGVGEEDGKRKGGARWRLWRRWLGHCELTPVAVHEVNDAPSIKAVEYSMYMAPAFGGEGGKGWWVGGQGAATLTGGVVFATRSLTHPFETLSTM